MMTRLLSHGTQSAVYFRRFRPNAVAPEAHLRGNDHKIVDVFFPPSFRTEEVASDKLDTAARQLCQRNGLAEVPVGADVIRVVDYLDLIECIHIGGLSDYNHLIGAAQAYGSANQLPVHHAYFSDLRHQFQKNEAARILACVRADLLSGTRQFDGVRFRENIDRVKELEPNFLDDPELAEAFGLVTDALERVTGNSPARTFAELLWPKQIPTEQSVLTSPEKGVDFCNRLPRREKQLFIYLEENKHRYVTSEEICQKFKISPAAFSSSFQRLKMSLKVHGSNYTILKTSKLGYRLMQLDAVNKP